MRSLWPAGDGRASSLSLQLAGCSCSCGGGSPGLSGALAVPAPASAWWAEGRIGSLLLPCGVWLVGRPHCRSSGCGWDTPSEFSEDQVRSHTGPCCKPARLRVSARGWRALNSSAVGAQCWPRAKVARGCLGDLGLLRGVPQVRLGAPTPSGILWSIPELGSHSSSIF